MKKAFYFNIVLLIILNLLIKPFYIFGIDRVVQNVVSPGSYGLYFALFNFAYIFQIINDFGIQNYNNRTVSSDPSKLRELFPNLILSKFILGFVFLIVVFLAAYLSGYDAKIYRLLILISFVHILNSLVLYLRSNVLALGFYVQDSLFSIADKSFMIIICGYLLFFSSQQPFQIEWFVLSQIISLSLTAIIILFFLRGSLRNLSFSIKLKNLIRLLKNSLPFALVVLLMSIYTRVDAVMLERLLPNGKIAVDSYAGAFRILDALNIIAFLFAGLLLPMFTKNLENKVELKKLINQGFLMLWAISFLLAISIASTANDWVYLLYTHANDQWGRVLSILSLCFIPMSGIYIYGTLITSNGQLKKLNFLLLSGAILNIFLNLILIPSYQAFGAAVSTLATQMLMFIGHILLAKKLLSLKWSTEIARKSTLYSLIIIVLAYFLIYQSGTTWIIKFIILVLCGAITSLVLKLFDVKEFIRIIRSKQK